MKRLLFLVALLLAGVGAVAQPSKAPPKARFTQGPGMGCCGCHICEPDPPGAK